MQLFFKPEEHFAWLPGHAVLIACDFKDSSV